VRRETDPLGLRIDGAAGEQLMQSDDDWPDWGGRNGQSATVAERQIKREIIKGGVGNGKSVEGRACQCGQNRRHQINPFAADHHAEIEVKPVDAGVFTKLRRDFAIRQDKVNRKIRGNLDLPAGRAELRHVVIEHIEPFGVVAVRENEIVTTGLR
jgi:hypothetical protein